MVEIEKGEIDKENESGMEGPCGGLVRLGKTDTLLSSSITKARDPDPPPEFILIS
jgi:hypothetical protein